jgi:hypothetical protein
MRSQVVAIIPILCFPAEELNRLILWVIAGYFPATLMKRNTKALSAIIAVPSCVGNIVHKAILNKDENGHRFGSFGPFAVAVADRLAVRVCPAWMPDSRLQGCIYGVPEARRSAARRFLACSFILNGDTDGSSPHSNWTNIV